MTEWQHAWLLAFIFTQLVEVPIYARALGVSLPVAFGASAITHPVVWFGFFSDAFDVDYLTRAVAAEAFAWLVEGVFFALVLWRREVGKRGPARLLAWTLWWSFVANASSVAAGLVSRHFFGAP